jgi:hypothetical protein
MNPFRKETAWDKVSRRVSSVEPRNLARSGLSAGATVLALTVASAATSAIRRRVEGS